MKLTLKESRDLFSALAEVVIRKHGSIAAYARARGVGDLKVKMIQAVEFAQEVKPCPRS